MTTIETTTNDQHGTTPMDKLRFGNIHVSLWANTVPNGAVFYSTRIERRYKDKNGNWKTSTSFSRDELPVVGELVNQAVLRIAQRDAEAGNGTEPVTVTAA